MTVPTSHIPDKSPPLLPYYCADHSQLSQALSSIQSAWLFFFVMEWESPSFLSCTLSKSLYFIKNKHPWFLHFLFFYVFLTTLSLSSWNQIGILHWKWISRFTIVSSVPINHEHSDFYCCSTVCNLFHDTVSPFMTQIIQSLKTRHKVLPNSNRLTSKQYQDGWPVCTTKAINVPQHYVQISYTDFSPHCTINV